MRQQRISLAKRRKNTLKSTVLTSEMAANAYTVSTNGHSNKKPKSHHRLKTDSIINNHY